MVGLRMGVGGWVVAGLGAGGWVGKWLEPMVDRGDGWINRWSASYVGVEGKGGGAGWVNR